MTKINFKAILGDITMLPEVQKYVAGNLSRAASIDNLAYALDQAGNDHFFNQKLGPLLMIGKYAFSKVFPDYYLNRIPIDRIVGRETKKPDAYKASNGF